MKHLDHKYVVRSESTGDLATAIYGNIKENFNDCDYITPRIKMSPKNETTETINKYYVIDQLPGKAKVLLSADSVDTRLNSITPTSLPPHPLYLKKYASIILLRSFDPTNGICNGTR